MKAADLERAIFLVEALKALDAIDGAWPKVKRNENGGPACELLVGNYSDDGGTPAAYAYLPIEYANALVPIARQMLRDELVSLGVDLGGWVA